MTDKPLLSAVREVLAPFAVLEPPKKRTYNAGAYSIRFSDIDAARDLLARLDALDAEELAKRRSIMAGLQADAMIQERRKRFGGGDD